MQQLLFSHPELVQLKSETSPFGYVMLGSINFGARFIVLEKIRSERNEHIFSNIEDAKRCYKEALNRTHKKRR